MRFIFAPTFSPYFSAVSLPTMHEVRSAIHAATCSGGIFASLPKMRTNFLGSIPNCAKPMLSSSLNFPPK